LKDFFNTAAISWVQGEEELVGKLSPPVYTVNELAHPVGQKDGHNSP